jgi:hypothetical protein
MLINNGHRMRGLALLGCLTAHVITVRAGVLDEPVAHPAIPLLTESGEHVLGSGQPYSPRQSCGGSGCHDYDKITHSYHIEQGRDEARDDYGSDHDQPQLISPGYFGGYNCMGGNNPDITAKKENASVDDFADLGTPDAVKRCQTCHSGGGWMEKDRNGRRFDQVDTSTVPYLDGDYYSRSVDADGNQVVQLWDWHASGVAENDCLLCHLKFDDMVTTDQNLDAESDSYTLARSVRSALMSSGQFRYAATAMLEFTNLNTGRDASADKTLLRFARSDVNDDGVIDATELTLGSDGLPVVEWNSEAFDAQGLVSIPMVRYPGNDNCMACHRTSNSRRGFYGFGEGAEAVYDEDGLQVRDYQDDVHKGQLWTEANGEQRQIENCNACHSRNYYNKSFGYQTDLDADHNFLKGNSDMDLGNDRDYTPPAKSCTYCHEDAQTPAIPSGHENMLAAHRERWKLAGDMAGYTEDSLNRITQTHLDALACETCHITDKTARGTPLQIMYRYAATEDGTLKIRPYNAKYRAQWRDKTTGYVFSKTERNSVFKMVVDADGNRSGDLINPLSGEVVGHVAVGMSHGSWRFSDPEDYPTIKALKAAYDGLLSLKGYENPNAVLVWGASNFYVLSHNTRPATESVQCEECHEKTARGAFSSLVASAGVLGSSNVKTVTTLPDKRLIDEGVVEMAFPSMQANEDGTITENTEDVLYYSALNPSLSRMGTAVAPVDSGYMVISDGQAGLSSLGLSSEEVVQLQALMPASSSIYLFKPRYGDPMVRAVALMSEKNGQADLVLSGYRFLVSLEGDATVESASQAAKLSLSNVYRIEAKNSDGENVDQFPGTPLYLKLPWSGTDTAKLSIIVSEDGEGWNAMDADQIVVAQPANGESDGYVVLHTTHLSYFAVAQASSGESVDSDGSESSSSRSGGGGGSLLLLPLLLGAWRLRQAWLRRGA